MAMFDESARFFAETLSRLSYENPFSPERAHWERLLVEANGQVRKTSVEHDPWQLGPGAEHPHLDWLRAQAQALLTHARCQLSQAEPAELELYADLVRFVLYYQFEPELKQLAAEVERGLGAFEVAAFTDFEAALCHWVPYTQMQRALFGSAAHLFAIAFQLSRAFQSLYRTVLGASRPTTELRASVWNSIFTVNRRRYERALFDRMHETSTLVVGASGTGKELVARAIGASRYIAFDAKRRVFVEEIAGSFLPLNLASLAVPLIESELFGHMRGAFSGAVAERRGFLELCPKHGTLFLDEIGELSVDLQVKLLRTIQTRRFHRVGDTTMRTFSGKLVSATNRDLNRAMSEGLMREDFYYRICSDVVWTPSLRTQLADRADDLQLLVHNIAQRLLPAAEVEAFVVEALASIEINVASDYAWPGNVRELEQCVRSVLIRGEYQPRGTLQDVASEPHLVKQLLNCGLNAEQLLDLYCSSVYEQTKNYSETARRLGIDRRTAKARVDSHLQHD